VKILLMFAKNFKEYPVICTIKSKDLQESNLKLSSYEDLIQEFFLLSFSN